MTDSAPPAAGRAPPAIAIIGMALRHPSADDPDAFWRDLVDRPPVDDRALAEHWTALAGRAALPDALAASRITVLDTPPIDSARYRIPPVQARGLARLQLMLLELADEALHDAGWPEAIDPERTDVVCGTCFGFDRTFANARRVDAARLIDGYLDRVPSGDQRPKLRRALRRHLNRQLAASAYDRVGEMASTIPSRVSMHFKLRGRSLAVEAADGTAFAALDTATTHLRAGLCDAAIVLVGQRIESGIVPAMLGFKRYLGAHRQPFSGAEGGVALGEGAGAIVLRRADDAREAGQRIYAVIEGLGQAQTPRAGALRYSTEVDDRVRAIDDAWRQSGAPRDRLAYVEVFGSGLPAEEAVEQDALVASFGDRTAPLAVGCVKDRLGHTFAYSGMAGLIKCALALHHGRVPSHGPRPPLAGGLTWGTGHVPLDRDDRLALDGASVTGTSWHAVLAHRDARPTAAPPPVTAVDAAEPIAVVAAEGRFAEAESADSFWRRSAETRGFVGPLPEAAFARAVYHAPTGMDPFGSYTDIGASMPVPERPPAGMRIVPRRWLDMDPAQRAVLDVAGRLFADFDPGALRGRGLVVLASNLSLGLERSLDTGLTLPMVGDALATADEIDPEALAAALADVAATLPRISPWSLDASLASASAAHIAHQFGLSAVPMAVEAACASSLAALDVAVRALRAGRCDYAITGGVELASNPRDMVLCSALGLLSRSQISPFCTKADGFSPGDGAALFALERLSDARAAGRPILGLIRAVGAASDARSLVAPDVHGQALAMRRAFAEVDFAPEAVQLVETHGTGTALGDQVEVLSTALVYCADRRAPLALTSVKSMIGHTFAAAGSAGILRTLLALRHRTLPPTVGLTRLNPRLALGALPARLVTRAEPWPGGAPRRAGVSAFGTGGIDYHVILEEAP